MSGQHFPKNSKPAAAAASEQQGANHFLKPELALALERQLGKLLAAPLAPGLYIVSTPIGNLSDISIRALCVLASADAVFCEDTRHSRKLLSAYGIGRKLEAYHDFSGDQDRARILAALRRGKSVALISDAGTPLIADPGFKLVRGAIAEGIGVFAIPGPSALLAALVTAGLPTDQFHFGGFLPSRQAAKRHELEAARAIPGTLVFYESGARIGETAEVLAEVFPGRPVAVTRELTKLFEATLRGSPGALLEEIRASQPAGEFVILIGPGEQKPPEQEDIESALRNAMRRVSLKEAVEEVAKGLGVGRKRVYNLALQLRDESNDRAQ
jgi:16S rRNA (cytidine1402-2'-O)-methyltransferase